MPQLVTRQVFTNLTFIPASGDGVVMSPALVAGKKFQVLLDMDPVDAVTPGKYIFMTLEHRPDSGAIWREAGGMSYVGKAGGYKQKDGITPQTNFGFKIDGNEISGHQVRLRMQPAHGIVNGLPLYSPGDTFNTGVTYNVI